MNNDNKNFVIRVYGLFVNSQKEILVSDEYQLDMKMTKFPGGGMQFGEGTKDCLRREIMEEMGQEIEITDHFYTTDYFQPAYFYDNYQLVSIYYLAKFKNDVKFKVSTKPFDFSELIPSYVQSCNIKYIYFDFNIIEQSEFQYNAD